MEHEGWPNWEERQQEQEHQGITETLGKQVTGIVTPVSICMALTVCLVRILNPEGVSGSSAVAIATVYYSEEVSNACIK